MAYITITNTFTSGAVAASGQVNQNFTDITAGLSDGTKDVHVRDISVTSAVVTGNVSIGGSTFEAWGSAYSVMQFGGNAGFLAETTEGTANQLSIVNNAYYSSGWKYKTTDGAVNQYMQSGGGHYFYAAASGAADAAITFKQIVLIDSTQFLVASNGLTNALKVDYTNDKLYSDIMKTTQATAVSTAILYVNLSTGEIFSTSAG